MLTQTLSCSLNVNSQEHPLGQPDALDETPAPHCEGSQLGSAVLLRGLGAQEGALCRVVPSL